jgi:adenylate/guanylate cyclase family protein
MTFEEILDQAMAMLQRRGRLTYSTLKRQFQLDGATLEDVKNELIYGQPLAVDEEERVLVWTGELLSASPPTIASPPVPASESARLPLSYTPAHLVEKIFTSRSALEGERKQVTVLFADLKGSMELLAERDPEEARQMLDPVLERMIEAVHRYAGTVNQVMGDGIMALYGWHSMPCGVRYGTRPWRTIGRPGPASGSRPALRCLPPSRCIAPCR